MTLSRNESISLPPLYGIANIESLRDPLEFVKKLLVAGVSLIQLRSKSLSPADLCALAVSVVSARDLLRDANQGDARIIINDEVEVCLAARADGVHLGQDDMPPGEARERLGSKYIVGFSTHTVEQLRSAPVQALDYLAFGPIFRSPTKHGHAPETGLAALSEAASLAALPIVAIGGITAENAGLVFAAGAGSVAVVSDLERAADLPALVRRYQEAKSTIKNV